MVVFEVVENCVLAVVKHVFLSVPLLPVFKDINILWLDCFGFHGEISLAGTLLNHAFATLAVRFWSVLTLL